MRPSKLLAGAVALSSFAAAWTEVLDGGNGVARVENLLFGRQDGGGDNNNDDNNENNSEAPKETATPKETGKEEQKEEATATGDSSDAPKETGDAKETGNDNDEEDPKETGDGDSKPTGTDKATGTKKPRPSFTGEPEFDPRLPEGGAAMITPGPMDGQQFYKVGDHITFAWNYTSVSKMPDALDVLVTCRNNPGATYTLAANMSGGGTPTIVWDTAAETTKKGSPPFLSDMYTMIIKDAELDIASITPRPGYFQMWNQFAFGLYTPRPYVPWKEYECANCLPKNGGLSINERQSLAVMMFTCGTTFASMLYFLHSFGLL